MKRPNVLWICTDTQRFDTLGCYGNEFVQTPNLDALARNGVLFERAYSQCPLCTPSRASFLTGRYPRTTRCRQNGQSIPDDEVLVTTLLHQAGYTCGLSGKLHLSPCHPSACKGTERRIDDGYDEFHWSHHPAPDWPTNEYIEWLAERGEKFRSRPFEGSKFIKTGMPTELHHTTWCAEKAIHFMESCAKFERPWLFSVNTFDPHDPYDPPGEYLEKYLNRLEEIPLPNYVEGELENKPIWQSIDHEAPYGGRARHAFSKMNEHDHRLCRAAYWAMCELIDTQVGRMVESLRRIGQLDNTIVIFTSDHGEMLGDHGIYFKGPYFYEPIVHMPLIISAPGMIQGGRQSKSLVELVDLAPTLLDACGMDRHAGMQGRSLWPMLTGVASLDNHREDVYCEFYNASGMYDLPAYATMLRTEAHKLVVYHGCDLGELYDLQADPDETTNRWDDAACAPVKLSMMKRLADRMAWTVDPLPDRKADW